MDLFREPDRPKKKRAAKKTKDETDGSVHMCIETFWNGYVKKWNRGQLPPEGYTKSEWILPDMRKIGKYGKDFKGLIASWGEAAVLDTIGIFFTTRDPQVVRTDYSFDAYFRLVSHLRLIGARRQTGERTAANLDAAARATGRK